MAVKDLVTELLAEQHKRLKEAHWFQGSIRMPEYLYTRLDAIGQRVGESRNRLIVRLLDEATFELAVELSREDEGSEINWDVASEMIEDIEVVQDRSELDGGDPAV